MTVQINVPTGKKTKTCLCNAKFCLCNTETDGVLVDEVHGKAFQIDEEVLHDGMV
jgi:hypothetical protein